MLESLEALLHPGDVFREKSWSRFLELGSTESYRHVRLRKLYESSFKAPPAIEEFSFLPFLISECHDCYCLFVNGIYYPNLSKPPKEAVILPLSEAFKTYGALLNARFSKQAAEESDPFAALNGALYQEGIFFYLPPKIVCKQPCQFLHIVQGEGCVTSPRMHLFFGKGAELTLCSRQAGVRKGSWINSYTDINLDEGAFLNLVTLLEEEQTNWHFDALRATLKRKSVFKSWSIANGGAASRQDYLIKLMGEESEASLNGIWSLEMHKEHHVNVLMEHHVPHTTSSQAFHGILAEQSRSSFEGKIYVHPEAQKTQAYQMNRNLLLSKHALAYCKPNLEIFADDVKASHGATIGQLDEEQLFYLKTRGITQEKAKAMLIQGFAQEILKTIPLVSLQQMSAALP